MKWHIPLVVCLVIASPVLAHFVYVLPVSGRPELQVVFSDSLAADENVSIDKIAATHLFAVDAAGRVTSLKWERADHSLRALLPTSAPVVVGGVTDYGFHQSKHTQNKAVWLKYYPKAILGDLAAAAKVRLGDRVPLEIVPVFRNGEVGFQALLRGKPLPAAEGGVLAPGGEKGLKTKTGADGLIEARFDRPGTYGLRVAHVEPSSGELGGKKYEEIRHYATLVVDVRPAARR